MVVLMLACCLQLYQTVMRNSKLPIFGKLFVVKLWIGANQETRNREKPYKGKVRTHDAVLYNLSGSPDARMLTAKAGSDPPG